MAQLYGFRFNENSLSMRRKRYYCRLVSKTNELFPILYRPLYDKRQTIQGVLEHAIEDRNTLYTAAVDFVNTELQAHGIYTYDTARIMDLFDYASGSFIDSCLEVTEQCCEAAHNREKQAFLREMRKSERTRIGAIGDSVGGLAVGLLKAGTLNLASGVVHSTFNAIGNVFSALEYHANIDEIYHSLSTFNTLVSGMIADLKQLPLLMSYILQAELGPSWRFPFEAYKLDEVTAVANQIKNNKIPKEQWKRLMVEIIVNKAPFIEAVYTFAEKYLGSDNGNLLKVAELFSASSYIKKHNAEIASNQYMRQREYTGRKFFGENLVQAENFVEGSGIYDLIYDEAKEVLCPDFNKVIEFLLTCTCFRRGKEEALFTRNARRHLVLFNFDLTLMERQTKIQKYCKLCHVHLRDGEIPYYFLDTTNFCTGTSGLVATNYGFYFSHSGKSNPLLYRKITAMPCEMFDHMDICYLGERVKTDLLNDALINNFLIFTCMFFKFGSF